MTVFHRNLLMTAAHKLFVLALHKALAKAAGVSTGSALALRQPASNDAQTPMIYAPSKRQAQPPFPTAWPAQPLYMQPPEPPRKRRITVTETIYEVRER